MQLRLDVADDLVRALTKLMLVTENPKRSCGDRKVREAVGQARRALDRLAKSRQQSVEELSAIASARQHWDGHAIVDEDENVVVERDGRLYVVGLLPVPWPPPAPQAEPVSWALYVNGDLVDDAFLSMQEAWESQEAQTAHATGQVVEVKPIDPDLAPER
jgi:hypothetical protein